MHEDKKTMFDFRKESQRQRRVVRSTEKFLSDLPIDAHHRYLFMRLNNQRGFQNLKEFETELLEIYENSNEVVRMFLDKKKVGIRLAHIIATKMSRQNQADYYQEVEAHGVKSASSKLMMYTSGCIQNLFTISEEIDV